jgi:catechol 2,3-dioxygenase-like lactoylglutathione lyase family enzyme
MLDQQPTGIHHVAFMAADIKKHIAFFSEVMGFPLVAIFDMHGVPGGIHTFLRINEKSYFSIVQLPNVADIPVTIGVTHAGRGEGASAKGTLQHMAFCVDTKAELMAMRDRIRSHGVNVLGPVEHGFTESIYFAGPDDTALEVAWAVKPIDADVWIDPKCLEQVGISSEEAARYRAPEAYSGPQLVPQPPYDPDKPHLHYPPKMYMKMLAKSDEAVLKSGDWSRAPSVSVQ